MPTIGYIQGSETEIKWSPQDFGDHILGQLPPMPEAGVLQSATVYVRNGDQFDRQFRVFVADSAKNIIASGPATNTPTSAAQNYTEDFSAGSVSLNSGERYYVGILAQSSVTNLRVISKTGEDWYLVSGTWDTINDPLGILTTPDNPPNTDRSVIVSLDYNAAGPTLDPVPATAFPGQSRTVTGTGFGATQGTGGLTIGGVAQTVTAWSDTSITFATVQGNNKYEAGKTLEVTTDAATTVSDTIELVADTANGFGYVDMSSPNTTDESSVAFNTTPTVVTGDQFEWEDFTPLGNLTVGDQGFVTNVDTEGTFRGRFWDATDSTWGAVETFEASVPGEEDTWPFGKGINPAATKNWTWGRRHPKTNMRVRIYK